MRIGHFYIKTGQRSDGSSNVLLALADHQAAAGHEVCLFNWYPDKSPSRVIKAGSSLENRGLRLAEFQSELKRLDILHVHSGFYSLKTFLVCVVSFMHGVPYIYSPHGALNFLKIANSSVKRRVFEHLFASFVLRNASCVHVFFAEDEGIYSACGARTLQVIPNGVDFVAFAPYQRIREYEAERFHLGFLGSLAIWKKGIDILVDACYLLPTLGVNNWILTIAGPDRYNELASLKARVEKLSLSDRVLFLGEVNGVGEFLAGLHLLVIPSRFEGFPLVFMEACATGLPVVVTPGTNVMDLVVRFGLGMVADFSPNSVARAIAEFYRSPRLLRECSENCLRFAEQYTWPRIAEEFVGMYRKYARQAR